LRRSVSLESRSVTESKETATRDMQITLLPVVDVSPPVMAIWSQRTIWDI